MKTVFFIRHAKSSWANPGLRDIERPLNKRGLRDAPFMAKMLSGRGIKADAILSSPANRALTTAKFFAKEHNIEMNDIIVKNSIYEAYADTVLRVIQSVSDDKDTIFVFGHNPTFTVIANFFSEDYIPNVPTCGIVGVEADIDSWSEFSKHNGRVTTYHYPKQYFD